MDRVVPGEKDLKIDLEIGVSESDLTQERTANVIATNGRRDKIMDQVWSGRLSMNESEKIDDLNYPLLIGKPQEQRLDLIEKRCDNVKSKKSRKASKPPRPPKGPALSASDQKLMREIAELAMRKRARMERMKSLRRMKTAKSPSPYTSIFAMIVTILFFVFLVFQGFSERDAVLSSDGSPAPAALANDRFVSVRFYNDFAPREKIDASPITSFRRFGFAGEGVSGADNEEKTLETSRGHSRGLFNDYQ